MGEWLDFLFPRDCAVTGAAMDITELGHLSAQGARALPLIRDPRCTRCGHPFQGWMRSGRTCPHCSGLAIGFGRAVCAFRAKDVARDLLHRAKYRGEPQLFDDLCRAALADDLFRRHLEGAILVPASLHPARRRERGFDQSVRLARSLAAGVAGCTMAELLIRRRPTRQQARLGREERQENLDDAFAVAPGVKIARQARLVVVDDVLTTGATLAAAAATLLAAGAARVDAAALAHG